MGDLHQTTSGWLRAFRDGRVIQIQLFVTFYTPECNIYIPMFHPGLHSFTSIKPLFELLYMKLRLPLFSLLLVAVCNIVFAKNPSYIQAKDGILIRSICVYFFEAA